MDFIIFSIKLNLVIIVSSSHDTMTLK